MTKKRRKVGKGELDEFYLALSALAREYQFRDREAEVSDGLSVTECYALEVLAEGEMMSVNAVARELRLDKSTASRTITTLVELGLARRMEDPDEHRAWRIVLTSRGHAEVERRKRRVEDQLRPVLSGLDAATTRKLVDALREIARLTRQRIRGTPRPSVRERNVGASGAAVRSRS